jgi:hypothetical protein
VVLHGLALGALKIRVSGVRFPLWPLVVTTFPNNCRCLDLFQLGNRRTPLVRDDVHYDGDGNPTLPTPNYGGPLVFQSPMSAHLGVSVDLGAEP